MFRNVHLEKKPNWRSSLALAWPADRHSSHWKQPMPAIDRGEGKRGRAWPFHDLFLGRAVPDDAFGEVSKGKAAYPRRSSAVFDPPALLHKLSPSLRAHDSFTPQSQIQSTQEILITAVQRDTERMQCDCLNLFLSLDKPSLGVSRTAEGRTGRLAGAGPISLPGISATFRAHLPPRCLVLGFPSSPRSEQPANMVLLRQPLGGQYWHKACVKEGRKGPGLWLKRTELTFLR